ncbi:MAG: hypothetical protein RLW62_05255, partial [Gammaproteobacteria bacterium]
AGAWTGAAAVDHVYATPGHYVLTVQVRDAAAGISTRTTGVTVVTPFTAAAGTASSHLASRGDGTVWVVNPDNDTVTVIDRADDSVRAEHRVCADPRAIAFDAAARAWVTCFDADEVLVLDADGRHLARLPFGYGSAPFGIVTSADGTRALVTLYGAGALALVDTTTLGELARLPLGPTPRALALTAAGDRALVTRFVSAADHGEVWDVAVSAAGLALNTTIELAHQWGVDTRFDGRGVPNYLAAIALSPDGRRAWVTAKKDNVTRGLYRSGSDLTQDNTVRAMITQIDLASASELGDRRRDLDNSEQPSALAFSPLGDYVFVALQGGNAVMVIDALKVEAGFSGVSSVVSRVGVGAAPQALLYDSRTDGDRLWVHDFLDRQLTRIDLARLIEDGAASFVTGQVPLVAQETLAPTVLAGKRVFYHAADPRMSGEGYMGCASCHVDGGHDGRTWDFSGRGEGLRNTPSLHGRAGMAHGLVHWSANFDEIQDFEHDMRGPFGGSGFLDDSDFAATATPLGAAKAGRSAELDALAAYLASLGPASVPRSPHRGASGALSAAATRGAGEFATLGCAACHAGAAGIASTAPVPALFDVGTLGTRSGARLGGALAGIDVPTLNGLWDTAPYLHHGAAATLADVFAVTGATVLQAEDAALTGNHEVRDAGHWSLAGLAVVRAGAYVDLQAGASASFAHTLPAAGDATLTLRYHANYQDAIVRLTINGDAQTLTLPRTLANDWRYRNWREHDVPITLAAGSNSLTLRFDGGVSFALDEIALGDTAALRAAASAHHAAAALPPSRFDDLLAYLLERDGRPHALPTLQVANGFDGSSFGGTRVLAGSTDALDASVQVAIDGAAFTAIGSGAAWTTVLDTRGLAAGWHTVTLRLVDAASATRVERQVQFYRDGASDRDGDGLRDDTEAGLGTDADRADSDGDGVGDGVEVAAGSDPRDPGSTPANVAVSQQIPLPPTALVLLALVLAGIARRGGRRAGAR